MKLKLIFQELALAAEENNALRSDLDRTREFIERETKSGGVDELTEQRLQVWIKFSDFVLTYKLQDLQRKYEDAQEELMTMEHAREDERIHSQIIAKELEDWRQVQFWAFFWFGIFTAISNAKIGEGSSSFKLMFRF